jgi:hypothetical protein
VLPGAGAGRAELTSRTSSAPSAVSALAKEFQSATVVLNFLGKVCPPMETCAYPQVVILLPPPCGYSACRRADDRSRKLFGLHPVALC